CRDAGTGGADGGAAARPLPAHPQGAAGAAAARRSRQECPAGQPRPPAGQPRWSVTTPARTGEREEKGHGLPRSGSAMSDKLLSVKQTAERLGVSPALVYSAGSSCNGSTVFCDG